KELKFLVGFFYFSGVKELYETLKELDAKGNLNNGHLKVLIGLNVDRTSYVLFEYAKALKLFSEEAVKKDLFESLKKAFTSQDVDNQDFYTQVYFFLKLLEEGKLVLKKTKDPNHAKLYLFKFNEELKEVLPNLFITGSSNLTKAGLESQHEFNVEIKDYGFEEAEAYFDRLWAQAVSLKKEDIQKIVHTIKEESLLKEITPFSAYVYLLKTYLDLHRSPTSLREIERLMIDKGYTPYSYQLEAVAQALATISAHNGVMLADVVGLGKTVIACLVAKALNKRGLVICPPHLIGDENKESGWKKYLEDFKLWDWEVRSVGKLKDVLKFVQRSNDIEVIIIDEAHRFRNENTKSYYYLREICRGRKVILLTATPFNNRPSDIYSLLKLFTIPKKSTIVFDEDLESRFRQYEVLFQKLGYIKNYAYSSDPKKRKRAERWYRDIFKEKKIDLNKVQLKTQELANEIRRIIEPVVIRRNRLDLRYYKDQIPISKVENPKEWFFELSKEQSAFYDKVIKTFAPFEPYLKGDKKQFTGAIYLPARYEKGLLYQSPDELEEGELSAEENFIFVYQQNLYDFMRRLLVKRFESSFGAFKNSVIRFKEIHKIAIDFAKKTKKFILDRKLMEDLVSQDEDSIFEELRRYEEDLTEKRVNTKFYKVYDIEKFKYKELFFKHLESDLRLFEELELRIEKLDLDKNDPKAKRLIAGIKDFLKDKRKVVIFSEYLDTASYLKPILEEEFGDRVLTAIGNLRKETISAIYKNFDAQHPEQEDKYDILLTTDKLSEGFNLNRAGAVINYDIPWNPVRVIQRVGRINRIGKKVYESIYIVNFFPTETGADIVRSREIAQTKMFMIHNVLGEDAKIFDPDEQPQISE
ncbi:MAG: helicase, partial [Deltaproteobacteria bacterium]